MKHLFWIIIAFCSHYLLVLFGSMFTIPFGYASLIWPVSGVLLGLYLLFGRAILVGALLSSLLTLYQESLTSPLPNYAVIILALTSVFQFIISKQLIIRLVALPVKIHFRSEVLKFLILSGPTATFLTASITTLTLWLTLNLTTDVLLYIWAVKWVGDFISIVFITPAMLFIVENDYVPKTKRPFAAMATSIFVLSVIFFIFNLNSFNKYKAKEQQFISSTSDFLLEMNVTQATIKHHLAALSGLFLTNSKISRNDFKTFTQKIDSSMIRIRAVAWLPMITDLERALFEAQLSKNGHGNFIKQLAVDGFQASVKQDFYLPIMYTEPLEANQSAIGLNVLTHPPVTESVHKAIYSGGFVVTPLLSLVQQQNKFTGIIVYYPVYKGEQVEQLNNHDKLNKLTGLVEVVFELDHLLNDVYQNTHNDNYTYQLTYGQNNVIAHPAFKSGMFEHSVTFNFFDKTGRLSFSSTPKFEKTLINWGSVLLVLVGCCVGIICVMFVFLIVSFNSSLTKKVNESTLKLTKKNKELSAANDAKNLFLANISHEYRTPLNAIIGFTEIAQREINDKNANDYFAKINHSSNILLNIVNDVLDISKMQAGELSLENRAFNPSIETLSVIDMLNEKAKEKSIKIAANFSPTFNCWVAGDDLRFKQILINLLNNAVKFTQNGEVNIKGDCQNINQTRVITVIIKDSGIGIEEAQQKNIFNSFAQAESSTTRKYGGTGLGLSIVKQLCKLMNGDISLSSQLGEGSEFTVKLTFDQTTEPDKKSTYKKEILQKINFEKFTILVVEDNKINQVIVQKQLMSIGAQSHVADDGQQALNYLEQHMPDLILMDLQMPNMDGFTASSLIKKNEKLKHIPIVILSASVGKEDKERAEQLGIKDFINKPFQQADIHDVLQKYLSD